jgi:MOSC domain-containing protein YiiM
MRLDSIQIAHPEALDVHGRSVVTGINKTGVGQARVDTGGVAGDHVVNTQHHGGPDQAVYLYSTEDYAWWEGELGRRLEPGLFGENLTVSTFGTNELRIGDRLALGDVLLELTSCRIPCDVFAARMNEPQWIRRFRDARRPGAYARVLHGGTVQVGQSIGRHAAPMEHVTVLDTQDLYYGDMEATASVLERFLASPIGERNRVECARRLAELEG